MNNAPAVTGSSWTSWHPHRQQQAFRHLINAFSYPGQVINIADDDTSALTVVLATLVDGECTLADPDCLVEPGLKIRLGAQAATVEKADFVVAKGAAPLALTPRCGTLDDPHLGATVLLLVDALGKGSGLHLTGPGIRDSQHLAVTGVDPRWWQQRAEWNALFPLGVDLILLSAHGVVAVPRTTRIQFSGAN